MLDVEAVATREEAADSLLELGIFGNVPDHRLERLELAAALGHEHAERLTNVEVHRLPWPRELPVHRERGDCPVGLDDTVECCDAVPGPVGRAASEQVVPGRRPKEIRHHPGDDAVPEVAGHWWRRHDVVGFEVDRGRTRVAASRPDGAECVRVEEPTRTRWRSAAGGNGSPTAHPCRSSSPASGTPARGWAPSNRGGKRPGSGSNCYYSYFSPISFWREGYRHPNATLPHYRYYGWGGGGVRLLLLSFFLLNAFVTFLSFYTTLFVSVPLKKLTRQLPPPSSMAMSLSRERHLFCYCLPLRIFFRFPILFCKRCFGNRRHLYLSVEASAAHRPERLAHRVSRLLKAGRRGLHSVGG